MIRTEFSGYILLALCLLLLPLRWTMGLVLAVSVHELFHLAALSAFRVRILGICISGRGVVIETEPMSRPTEALCALSGPLGSFTLLGIAQYYPEAALIGLLQGFFNLLPIYPLDGGRFVRCIAPPALCRAVEMFVWILLFGTGLWLWTSRNFGFCAVIPGIWTGILLIQGKFPCKQTDMAVQ